MVLLLVNISTSYGTLQRRSGADFFGQTFVWLLKNHEHHPLDPYLDKLGGSSVGARGAGGGGGGGGGRGGVGLTRWGAHKWSRGMLVPTKPNDVCIEQVQ